MPENTKSPVSTCVVAMYHYVRDTERTAFPGIKAISVTDFERQLHWLQEEREVVSFPNFLAWWRGERVTDRPIALLTFDDGVVDHYETVLPILRRRGLSGVFLLCGAAMDEEPILLNVHAIHFLLAKIGSERFMQEVEAAVRRSGHAVQSHPTDGTGLYRYDKSKDAKIKRLLNYELPYDKVDRILRELFEHHLGSPQAFAKELYLSRTQVRAMVESGMTIGYHTHTHRVLSRLSEADQRSELSDGAERIRSLTGQTEVPLSYPYGHRQTIDDRTLAIVRQAGYAAAFTTVRAALTPREGDLLLLPRFDTKDLPPFTAAPCA